MLQTTHLYRGYGRSSASTGAPRQAIRLLPALPSLPAYTADAVVRLSFDTRGKKEHAHEEEGDDRSSFHPYVTMSTILPWMCQRAARSCAHRASANGNVLSMATRTVPASSKRPSSASCGLFEPTWVIEPV